jgi:hypothetical protein
MPDPPSYGSSVCLRCSAPLTASSDDQVGRIPLCSTCSAQIGEWSRPNWLKASLSILFIPGPAIALLTFPGVILHEAAHLFFCKLFKLRVYDVCFFRFSNPAGYVIHEETENFTALFFVSLGPFVFNTFLCIVFCTAAFLPVWVLKVRDPLAYFFYWLGLSIGMHAIPSQADLSNLWEMTPSRARRGNILAIISLPLIAILHVVNLGRVVWADLAYGIAVGVLGPVALFRALARGLIKG